MKNKISIFFKNYFESWTYSDWSLNWIIFFSIFYQKLVPVGFIFWIILAFKNWRKQSFKSFFKSIYSTPGFWFILYYFLLLIGMFWTDNLSFGLSKLENKLSFILLPILLFSTQLKTVLFQWKNTFIYALLFTMIVYEFVALIHSTEAPESTPLMYFRESNFTIFMHRSYFACYLVIGVILIMEKLWSKFSFWNTLLFLIFSVGILQTFSKAGIGSYLIVIILFSFFKLYQKSLLFSIGVVISVIISSYSILSFDNLLSIRFNNMLEAVENTPLSNNNSVESNASRILMWSASAEVIKENPLLGVGTGDYDDALAQQNLKLNNQGVLKERLNSHSQFLNTWVQLGFFGFAVLSMMFIIPMTGSFSIYKILILVTFFLNFLFESFLETQAGIILFCIFIMLLFSPKSLLNDAFQSTSKNGS